MSYVLNKVVIVVLLWFERNCLLKGVALYMCVELSYVFWSDNAPPSPHRNYRLANKNLPSNYWSGDQDSQNDIGYWHFFQVASQNMNLKPIAEGSRYFGHRT